MATEQQISSPAGEGGIATGSESLTVTDNRTGRTYELPISDGTVRAMDLRQIKVDESEFGMMAYDPAFTNTASCRSAITFIDGEAGILEHRGYSIEQLCERSTFLEVAYLLIFGELPTQPQLDRWVFDITHHTYVHEDLKQLFDGLPLRRPPDGDAAGRGRGALDLLPRREADRRPRRALHGSGQADRQDPDPRRLLLPSQHGLSLRLPRQRPELLRELPLDDVQENGSPARPQRSTLEGARRALHPPRRPRTELLDQRGSRRRLLRRRPLLGGRGRCRGAVRAAARRRQRGGAEDAATDRVPGQHPRLPRAGEGARGETDGLRPPRLQELRPAGADHPAAHGRGLRGDRVQLAGRDRARARETRPRGRVLHLAQALPERRLLLGDHLRGARDPDQHVHRDLRHPPHRRLGRAVDGDERRHASRRSPARARSTPAIASASTSRSPDREGPEKIVGPPAKRPKRPRRGA